MKIQNIETYLLKVPYMEPEMKGVLCDLLYVRVDTDTGLSGWGQAWSMKLADVTKAVLDNNLTSLCIGQSADDYSDWLPELVKAHGNARHGPLTYAVSAIDIALWDLKGKSSGVPLHSLLGDSNRTELDVYASLIFYKDAERVAEKSKEAAALGYKHIKLHEEAVGAVRASREALGDDVSIRLDPAASYPWSAEEAKAIAPEFEEFNLTWLEEPIWPVEDYYNLGELSTLATIPLAAGENCISALDFRHLREIGKATYLQPSVTKIGGISETRKVIAYAKQSGAVYTPHSFYYGPGYLASIHLVAICPHYPLMEHPYYAIEAYPYGDNMMVHEGQIEIPLGPGLGIDPIVDFLNEYRI